MNEWINKIKPYTCIIVATFGEKGTFLRTSDSNSLIEALNYSRLPISIKWFPWSVDVRVLKIKPKITNPVNSFLFIPLLCVVYWQILYLPFYFYWPGHPTLTLTRVRIFRSSIFVDPQYHFLSISLHCSSPFKVVLGLQLKSWLRDFNTLICWNPLNLRNRQW